MRFYQAIHDGTAWGPAGDTGLPYSGGRGDTIRVAAGWSGRVHAVWQDQAGTSSEVFHSQRPAGGSWSPPESVSRSPLEDSGEPAIQRGRYFLHVVWVEQDPLDGVGRVHGATAERSCQDQTVKQRRRSVDRARKEALVAELHETFETNARCRRLRPLADDLQAVVEETWEHLQAGATAPPFAAFAEDASDVDQSVFGQLVVTALHVPLAVFRPEEDAERSVSFWGTPW